MTVGQELWIQRLRLTISNTEINSVILGKEFESNYITMYPPAEIQHTWVWQTR